MFMIARKIIKKLSWMFDEVWNSLLSTWDFPTYCAKFSHAQPNRTSEIGGDLHTGDFISTHGHAICMVSTLKRIFVISL